PLSVHRSILSRFGASGKPGQFNLGTVPALGIVFADYNLWLALFAGLTGLAIWLLPRFVPWFYARVGERVHEPRIKFLLLVRPNPVALTCSCQAAARTRRFQ
ncbi:MAG: hypothetical protein ACLFWF_04330, partial [Alphaproteobacteria bacterium]